MFNSGCAATPTGKPVWFIKEDNRGRFRKFPDHLNHMVEEKFQEWTALGGPAEFVVAYCWASREYEVTFHNMKQTNVIMSTVRSVTRITAWEGGQLLNCHCA